MRYFIISFFIAALSISSVDLQAQEIYEIVGSVVDQETKEPLEFVNIGIEGTFIGGASNSSGLFSFKAKQSFEGYNLYFSAIGYETVRIPWSRVVEKKSLEIYMVKQMTEIKSVDITAKSLVLYRVLRTAREQIETNYISRPYSSTAYYHNREFIGDSLYKDRKAALSLYDSRGYGSRDRAESYGSIGYEFTQTKRNFDVDNLFKGTSRVDEMLEFDIVRIGGNILDVIYLKDYDLKEDGETIYDGNKVWIISYFLKEPDISRTGDAYALTYRGKIYIDKSTYAVVKNETYVTVSNYHPQGRSIITEVNLDRKVESANYYFSTAYKKSGDKYVLALSRSERNTIYRTATGVESYRYVTDLLINDSEISMPTVIEERNYFEDTPYNKEFWDSYNYLIE